MTFRLLPIGAGYSRRLSARGCSVCWPIIFARLPFAWEFALKCAWRSRAAMGGRFCRFRTASTLSVGGRSLRSSSAVAGQPYRLLYFGSVFGNAQLASILDICRSVARLNAQGFAVDFDIASPTLHLAANKEALTIHPSIRLVTPTEDDRAFFEQLAAADALVLPVNYDAGTVEFIRYSMPTKVPAYMASGTPILVYGPRGVAQVDYADARGLGPCGQRSGAGGSRCGSSAHLVRRSTARRVAHPRPGARGGEPRQYEGAHAIPEHP